MEKYLGIALIIISIGIMLYFIASLGFNTYFSLSKEKIEVQTQNSNSSNTNEIE